MHWLPVQERTPGGPVATDGPFLQVYSYRTVMRAEAQVVTILQKHYGVISLAKFAGAFDDGLENRRDIGWRGSDDAKDVAAAGLVGEGLGEVTGFRLHLVEQAHVADRDHGLIGKSLQQGDL